MHKHQSSHPDSFPSGPNYEPGKYGRMFPQLDPWKTDECSGDPNLYLKTLGNQNNDLFFTEARKDSDMPAGYTYLGQFIAHDLSYDPTSVEDRQSDPYFLKNFRTPAFDLDSVYGGGPSCNTKLYESSDKASFVLAKVETTEQPKLQFYDLPRNANIAVVADSRNDENVLISQFQVAIMLLHNKFVEKIASSSSGVDVFKEARKLVTWYYQYVILHDYLPMIVGHEVPISTQNECDSNPSCKNCKYINFIPVEFSTAAFRFGHSQIKFAYQFFLGGKTNLKLFPDPRLKSKFYIDWRIFFGDGLPLNSIEKTNLIKQNKKDKVFNAKKLKLGFAIIKNNKIRPQLSDSLRELKHWGEEINVITRDFLRGLKMELPSGQSIEKELGFLPLDWTILEKHLKLNFPKNLNLDKFKSNTPLIYYILAEAHLKKGGNSLGPVGGFIVKEVVLGLIKSDKNSYLNVQKDWIPMDKFSKEKPDFTMTDLLELAGVLNGALVPNP